MPASTAKLVLRGRSIRWSSPVLFNDPFDVPRELAFGLSSPEIQLAVGKHFAHLLQNPPANHDELHPSVSMALKGVEGAAPDLMKKLVDGALDEAAKQAAKRDGRSLEAMRAMWRDWLPDFRILCLCASHDKLPMWYHYADKYTGVVIELACSDDRDSPWLVAEPAQYPKEPPEIFSAAGWGRLMTLRPETAIHKMLQAYTFNKVPDWSYEEEWRITSFKRPNDLGHYTDWRVAPMDFANVFFGPHVSDDDRTEILTLLKDGLRHVVPFQARFELDRRMSFQPLTVN
jgi:hypothetical protein